MANILPALLVPDPLYNILRFCFYARQERSEIALIKVKGKTLALRLTLCIDLVQNPTITETDGGALRLSIPKLLLLALLLQQMLTIAIV